MSVTHTFTFAHAQRHAQMHTARQGGESIELFQLRLDNAACGLLRASRDPATKLHRFLTVTHRFYTPDARAAELARLTGDVLLAGAPAAPAYTLVPLQVAG